MSGERFIKTRVEAIIMVVTIIGGLSYLGLHFYFKYGRYF